MDDDYDMLNRNGRSEEVTRRTKAITEVEMRSYDLEMRARSAEAAIGRIKFWVQIALGLATAVAIASFTAAHWMGSVAHTPELGVVTTRVTVVETKVDTMSADMRWLRDQMTEIARTVKAPMVVQPQTLTPPMPVTESKR